MHVYLISTRLNKNKKEDPKKVLWDSYSSLDHEQSIPSLIDENIDKYRESYLNIINSLRKYHYNDQSIEKTLEFDDISYWWTSLLQEKSVYKSPEIYTLFQFMALRDLCLEHDAAKIVLVGANKNMILLFEDFCSLNSIDLKLKKDGTKNTRTKIRYLLKRVIKRKAPQFVKAVICFIMFIVNRRESFLHVIEKPAPIDGLISIMSYLPNFDQKEAEGGTFVSHYWGSLPNDLLSNKGEVNHLLLYAKSLKFSYADAIQFTNHMNKCNNQGNFFLIDSFLNFRVVISSMRQYVKIYFKSFKLNSVLKHFQNEKHIKLPVNRALKSSFLSSIRGTNAITSILYSELFKSFFSQLKTQKLGMYLMENHGWERTFVNLWKKNNNGKLIGYAHSTIRSEDFRYFQPRVCNRDKELEHYFPDKIVTNTKDGYNSLQNQGIPENNIYIAEALRYLYLNDITVKRRCHDTSTILILTDINERNTRHILSICNAVLAKIKYNVVIKPHPFLPNAESIISDMLPDINNVCISHDHLRDLIDQSDFIILSSRTSAILEVIEKRIPYTVILDPQSFNLSPLPISSINYVRTADELIDKIENINKNESTATSLILDKGLKRWKQILEDNYER